MFTESISKGMSVNAFNSPSKTDCSFSFKHACKLQQAKALMHRTKVVKR